LINLAAGNSLFLNNFFVSSPNFAEIWLAIYFVKGKMDKAVPSKKKMLVDLQSLYANQLPLKSNV
jgi:hypothetical protein